MNIHSKFGDYQVVKEPDLSFLKKLCKAADAMIVADEQVFRLYREYFADVPEERLYLVQAAEEHKIMETALAVCEKMMDLPAKRNARLISAGGGIIQDITGFAASILYRGIRWTYVPTTLLAGCDSCIGGKTSLNYKNYKNLIGTFYPPDEIHICPAFFATLTDRDFESGLGEVVKFHIMAGRKGLESLEAHMDALLNRQEQVLLQFVESSLRFKKAVIEADEFDRGERVKLNFAHTFGHAAESVSGYKILHGTAVAIGMIMANRISVKRRLLTQEACQRTERLLLRIIHIKERLTEYPAGQFVEAVRKDKKQVSDCLTAVLLTEEVLTGEDMGLIVVHDIQTEEITEALYYFQELYDTYHRGNR